MRARLPHFLGQEESESLLFGKVVYAPLPPSLNSKPYPPHLNCGLGVIEPEVNPGDLRSKAQSHEFGLCGSQDLPKFP